MVNNNIENISTEFEKLDWKEGLSEKEQRMLSVYWEITDENEKKSIISNIKRLNSLNAELQSINWKIDLIDTLAEQDIEKTKFKQAIKDILREKNRIIQLEVASKKSGTDKRKELLKWKSIDNISARDLLDAENEGNWFLSKTFAYKISKDENGEEIETPLIQNDIKEKDLIKIDFGKNQSANLRIWAGDILPSSIRMVKVIDDKWQEFIWTREIAWNKVWYYDENNRYIPIFNNYKIYIPSSEELQNPEYSKFWLKSIFASKEELDELEKDEKEAKKRYVSDLELLVKTDLIKETVSKLSEEVWDVSPYRNKLEKIIEKAKEYKDKQDFSLYSEESLDLAIARLTKTKDILGDKEINFDWDKYKEYIAAHESGWNYYARNDNLWRKKWVHPDKWAFGKYQFTTETLRWYWVDLGSPDEDKIKDFLSNSSLQEEVMDKYMLYAIEKHIIPNGTLMASITSKEHDISYYLALWHIWWPWAMTKQAWSDWLWTNVTAYASWVERKMLWN